MDHSWKIHLDPVALFYIESVESRTGVGEKMLS